MEGNTFRLVFNHPYLRQIIFEGVRECNRQYLRADSTYFSNLNHACLSYNEIRSIGWMVRNGYINLLVYKLDRDPTSLYINSMKDQEAICKCPHLTHSLFVRVYKHLEGTWTSGSNQHVWVTHSGSIERINYIHQKKITRSPGLHCVISNAFKSGNKEIGLTICKQLLEKEYNKKEDREDDTIKLDPDLKASLYMVYDLLVKYKQLQFIQKHIKQKLGYFSYYNTPQIIYNGDVEFAKVHLGLHDRSYTPHGGLWKLTKSYISSFEAHFNSIGGFDNPIVQRQIHNNPIILETFLPRMFPLIKLNLVPDILEKEKNIINTFKFNNSQNNQNNNNNNQSLVYDLIHIYIMLLYQYPIVDKKYLQFMVKSFISKEFLEFTSRYLNSGISKLEYLIIYVQCIMEFGQLEHIQFIFECGCYDTIVTRVHWIAKSIPIYQYLKSMNVYLDDDEFLCNALKANSKEMMEYWLNNLKPKTYCIANLMEMFATSIGDNGLKSFKLNLDNETIVKILERCLPLSYDGTWACERSACNFLFLNYYIVIPQLQINKLYTSSHRYLHYILSLACFNGRMDIIDQIISTLGKTLLESRDLLYKMAYYFISGGQMKCFVHYITQYDIIRNYIQEIEIKNNIESIPLSIMKTIFSYSKGTKMDVISRFDYFLPFLIKSGKLETIHYILDINEGPHPEHIINTIKLLKCTFNNYNYTLQVLSQLPIYLVQPFTNSYTTWIPKVIKKIYNLKIKSPNQITNIMFVIIDRFYPHLKDNQKVSKKIASLVSSYNKINNSNKR